MAAQPGSPNGEHHSTCDTRVPLQTARMNWSGVALEFFVESGRDLPSASSCVQIRSCSSGCGVRRALRTAAPAVSLPVSPGTLDAAQIDARRPRVDRSACCDRLSSQLALIAVCHVLKSV